MSWADGRTIAARIRRKEKLKERKERGGGGM